VRVQLGIVDEAPEEAAAETEAPQAVPDLPSAPSHKVTVPSKAAEVEEEEEEEEEGAAERE